MVDTPPLTGPLPGSPGVSLRGGVSPGSSPTEPDGDGFPELPVGGLDGEFDGGCDGVELGVGDVDDDRS